MQTQSNQAYRHFVSEIQSLLESARRNVAKSVNAVLTATYWEIGRRIVEYNQHGRTRAEYGEAVLENLARDLTKRLGRGFSRQNIQQMREFYLAYPLNQICQTVSGKSKSQELNLAGIACNFKLSWSHYVRLLSIKNENARKFYEIEALRGGWSIRQFERQMDSQFYERAALSSDKAVVLRKGEIKKDQDHVTPESEIKDPYVLEFLGLKDEYSESDLEEALIRHLESFLLELGGNFAFVARQKRLRVGNEWYRVDLVFYHRTLRCLVLVDLKIGKFTHADAGQMHLYLNYAREHWTRSEENPPVGLVLCAQKNETVARYALEGLSNKVLAAEYKTTLPDEKKLVEELNRTRKRIVRDGIR